MRIIGMGSVLVLVLFACVTGAGAQDPASPTQPPVSSNPPASGASQSPEAAPPAAVTLNDVLDRMIQREHMFISQMRRMHPLVETYLQDLKNESTEDTTPVKDQYFLGRFDMTDSPDDISYVGQPGFGHRMLTKMTGIYSLHYLPLGFAQMVLLDTDFQKKFYFAAW